MKNNAYGTFKQEKWTQSALVTDLHPRQNTWKAALCLLGIWSIPKFAVRHSNSVESMCKIVQIFTLNSYMQQFPLAEWKNSD